MSTFEKITVDIAVELGSAQMPIYQLLRMGRGAVIALDTSEDDDVTILANNMPVAHGQVILRGERVGVSITDVMLRPIEKRVNDSVKKLRFVEHGPTPEHEPKQEQDPAPE